MHAANATADHVNTYFIVIVADQTVATWKVRCLHLPHETKHKINRL